MATQKPISTISYNTEAFLKEKLDIWVKAHLIQAYQYICHEGEDGDKNHIHLRIEPNKRIDQMDLSEELKEYQFGKEKPLGVRTWHFSKEEDWILYAVHDEQYLKLKYGDDKGEKIPYQWQDIKTSADYDMEVAFRRAKASLKHSSASMVTRLMNGEKASNLILEGENVFTVNAVVRGLFENDYQRVIRERDEALKKCKALESDFEKLVDAVENFGLHICVNDENGDYYVML